MKSFVKILAAAILVACLPSIASADHRAFDGHRAAAVARAGKAVVTAPVRAFRNRERTPIVNGLKAAGRVVAALPRPRRCGGR